MEIEVGCVVSYAIGKSGVVRFVGETDFAQGEWVGIELDKPEGKNNGELNGRVYFTCAPNYGLFCKKSQVRKQTAGCICERVCVCVCICIRPTMWVRMLINIAY